MSLPVKFNMLDKDGKILSSNISICTVNNYDDYSNLNKIYKSFVENYYHPMRIRNIEVHYAVPTHIPAYMFDIKRGGLYPNRFS